MATQWGDVLIQCPYYSGMDDRKPRCYISCCDSEGIIQRVFNSREERRQYIQKYCIDKDRYPFCPVCIAIDFFEGEQ